MPQSEKVSSFYLDGTKYELDGGGSEYNAGKGIEIGIADNYSAIKGPCPDGFHIPTSTEVNTLRYILIDSFGRTANPDVAEYLNMPLCGYIDKDGNTQDEGEDVSMWACTPRNSTTAFAISGYYGYSEKGSMMPIRPFKNEPVAPYGDDWQLVWKADDLYDNRGQVWRNRELGLISVSLNLETWITIADKNLGATIVWEDGDEFTSDNVGYLYQRGNNYGIPYEDTPTTSQTQVDASGYGPGNYYSSSTIIRGYADRSSVENGNLRGGVTGIVGVDNTITNTGVTSFNSKSGDVSIQAGRGIAIQNGITYLDDQGPCPEGYHVPIEIEIQKMLDVWADLGGSGNISDFTAAYKLPLAGYRNSSTGDIAGQGTEAHYFSSSFWNGNYAYSICINCSSYPGEIKTRSTAQAAGASIRPFKNIAVKPDTSWTKLYGNSIEQGGIFWSSSKGIISFSSNGEDWTTISDKNLGATAVWNSGDTLSETNCGGYFQWGNNYMLPFTGTVTTSSQKVNASGYGPGNYYSSSTFITDTYSWDSSHNQNIWGGQTTSLMAENRITNTGVLSVNGQTGYVTIASPDMSNYLAKNNTTAFTPSGNYNPATKKYVDDNSFKLAPSSPLTPKYRRYGTQAQYEALSQYYTDTPGDTVYHTT